LGQVELADRVAQVRRVLQVDDSPRGVFVTRDVRRVVRPQPADDYKPMLRALYTELIEPVAGALPDDGTPVVIEPHAALWLLPFAALLSSEDTWLIDRWPLLYSPSAQVLDEIRQERDYGGPKDLKALVVGNPTMPKVPRRNGLEIELKPLPGAEAEAKTIAGLFPESQTTLLLGPAADWANVVALMPQHGILHLATHGIAYAEEPLASFVALGTPEATVVKALEERLQAVRAGFVQAQLLHKLLHNAESPDGLLTARHILMLPLPADLVVLSACQTGLGKVSGDGMIGLSRAFLVAGARAVLVSQWSISDEATAALMAGFYQGYIELDDKAMALQRAMRELRSKPEYAHPRYWAPFVVIGTEA
jgi:CHAT domain-containing protein